MNAPAPSIWRSIGPAIITASVVLGPGSILTSSKVGAANGYTMIWVLILAGILMWGMTALSARLGVVLDGTLCEELSQRAGRGFAVLAGVCLFLVAACFQFSNNLGVFAAVEPFFGDLSSQVFLTVNVPSLSGGEPTTLRFATPDVLVLVLNLGIIAAVFGFRHLYQPLEYLMMIMVGLMIIGFMGNLWFVHFSLPDMLQGFVPSLPKLDEETEAKLFTRLLPVLGLIGTTFSVGGAFYQSYLVRQKGWTREHLAQGMIDSAVGIGLLVGITLVVMVTAVGVFYGQAPMPKLESAADVAEALRPLFGQQAVILFCMGIFAGAFSSFLVNAMIGGAILSDGLGFGGYLHQRGVKIGTVLALLLGMVVAIYSRASGAAPVSMIVFAQAMTVLGNPLLAAVMLWLAIRPDLTGARKVPRWMLVLGGLGFLVVLALAGRTVYNLVG